MVKHLAGAIALLCAAALCAGCATVIHGTTERVQIDSMPAGAQVAIDDSRQPITTPAAVNLTRGHAHTLVFHKPGYQDATANLTSSTSGWILGNLIAGGMVGIAIDATNGAGRKLSADKVNMSLKPLPPGTDAAAAPVHRVEAAEAVDVPPREIEIVRIRDRQTAPQPDGFRPTVAPTGPEGPPPEDFTDDEAGYAGPAAQAPLPDAYQR